MFLSIPIYLYLSPTPYPNLWANNQLSTIIAEAARVPYYNIGPHSPGKQASITDTINQV